MNLLPFRNIARRISTLYKANGFIFATICLGGEFRRWLIGTLLAWKFGNRVSIGRHTMVRGANHIRFGQRFRAGDFLWIEAITEDYGDSLSPTIFIKDDVNASQFVHIAATNYVEIGNGVLIGSRVIITDHHHGCYKGGSQSDATVRPMLRPLSRGLRTVIGDGVWLGDGVVVMPGSRIGRGCVVGANSVVIGEIPEFCIAVGAPAKVVKRFEAESGHWIAV